EDGQRTDLLVQGPRDGAQAGIGRKQTVLVKVQYLSHDSALHGFEKPAFRGVRAMVTGVIRYCHLPWPPLAISPRRRRAGRRIRAPPDAAGSCWQPRLPDSARSWQ